MNCLKCKKRILKDTGKHGFHLTCFKEEFALDDDFDFVDLIPKKSDSSPVQKNSFESKIATSFFHGAFKKYSSRMGTKKYILKVREEQYPELPHIEYVSNQIAKELGLKVADFHFIMFDNKIPTFVTKNFMDDYSSGNLVHIWHYLKKNEGEFNCENLLNIIFEETKRPLDQKDFIQICLFDMLIGNHDRHGRNLSIIEMKGKKIFSPCYDNPSYIGIEDSQMLGSEISPRGKIYTKESQEPDIISYIREFKRLGHENIVNEFILSVDINRIKKLIYSFGMSERRKEAFFKLIKNNIDKAQNEIK